MLSAPAVELDEFQPALAFNDFLETFKASLHHVFHVRADANRFGLERGLPPFALRDIMACNPLSVAIPSEFGGRGSKVHETLAMLSAAAYESLALSLTLGINSALFLQPVAKYAQEKVKRPIFERFLQDQAMGGLMITEPEYGTDALSMQTSFNEHKSHYRLEGIKHWGGLSGWADYWLVTARERTDKGLKRDIGFFVCDASQPSEVIEVEEYYQNLGLYMIPYGRNRVDVLVPKAQRLEPHSTGIKMMLDLLHRSRLQFPGMALGFVQRLLDEALKHCKDRLVGGKPLLELDQVQARLSKLQTGFTVCSAMCAYSSKNAGVANDLSGWGLEANVLKTVATDIMHDSAQSLLQLVGAKGYRLDHIAGRSTVDSRPFQIFEGSNDVLYAQIAESVLKMMRSIKEDNLLNFLSTHPLTETVAERFKKLLNFEVSLQLPQRKLVDLGRVLGRVASLGFVLELGSQGFRKDLIEQSAANLTQETAQLLSNFRAANNTRVIDDYKSEGDWLEALRVS